MFGFMRSARFAVLGAALLAGGLFLSCSDDDSGSSSFTGVKISVASSKSSSGTEDTEESSESNSVIITPTFYNEDAADSSVSVTLAVTADSTNGAYFGTESETTSTSVTSGQSATLTFGSETGSVTVSASYGENYESTMAVINGDDTETVSGYAALNWSLDASSLTQVTVTSKNDLVTYAETGNYLIYVSGMIDMSEGSLPSDNTDSSGNLSSFISTNTSGAYSSWTTWRDAFAKACTTSSDNTTNDSTINGYQTALVKAWKSLIRLDVASNTMIVGLDSNSGIKGGYISISGKSNIVIRNLVIQDAFDPFPHHESGDGYNAEYDGIGIQGSSSNIWIDHCTFKDTMALAYVSTGGSTSEKWQTYDGLLDIKNSSTYITVSYCKFMDHDKTSLIGSSDSDGDSSSRMITYHHNYFYNCAQRLPMVRNTTFHMYNNCFDSSSSAPYTQSYAVGVRSGAIVYSENNYFGSGIKYSFTASSSSKGTLYQSGDSDSSSSGKNSSYISSRGSTKFSSAVNAYTYTPQTASEAKTTVTAEDGAGATLTF